MTKADIVERIQDVTGVTKVESYEMLESLREIIKKTLERGETVKVSGFGNFEVKTKKDRRGRNPQTGESITITARNVLTFKPSNVLKQKVNS